MPTWYKDMYAADCNNTINSKAQINDHMVYLQLASYETDKTLVSKSVTTHPTFYAI